MLRLMLLAGTVSWLTACGTVINGFSDEVLFQTVPPGATITLSDGQSCVAPCSLQVARTVSPRVVVSKPGCQRINKEMPALYPEGGTAWHSLLDWQTGAPAQHQPNPVTVTLDCSQANTVTIEPYDEKTLSLIKGDMNDQAEMPPFDAEAFLRLRNRNFPRSTAPDAVPGGGAIAP